MQNKNYPNPKPQTPNPPQLKPCLSNSPPPASSLTRADCSLPRADRSRLISNLDFRSPPPRLIYPSQSTGLAPPALYLLKEDDDDSDKEEEDDCLPGQRADPSIRLARTRAKGGEAPPYVSSFFVYKPRRRDSRLPSFCLAVKILSGLTRPIVSFPFLTRPN